MESEFWQPANFNFAVGFTAILYVLGIYFFMLPAFLERLRHPRSVPLPRIGLTRRTPLYVLIYFLSPFIFIVLIVMMILMGVVSIFSVLMLMVMSPFYWLFSHLPFDTKSSFSIARWKRLGGRMFEYSRNMFLWLAGESPIHKMESLKGEVKK